MPGRSMPWFPMYSDEWLFGSTSQELELEEQAVFLKLLCLANKDDGWIRANELMGYPPPRLAGIIGVPEGVLVTTLEKCVKYEKLDAHENGIYFVTNWDKYQLSKRYKREFRNPGSGKEEHSSGTEEHSSGKEEHSSAETEHCSPKADAKREENRKEEKRREGELHQETHQDTDDAQVHSEKAPHTPQKLFLKAWNAAYRECWEKDEDYPATEHELRAAKKAITNINLPKHVAYAAYYNRHDPKVGVDDGKYPPTIDNYFKAVTVYSTKLKKGNKKWQESQNWARDFLRKNRPASTGK